MINFVIENDWKWNHCRLPIKRCDKKGRRKEEEYFYQIMNSEDTGPINEAKIKIQLDKPFPFEPDTGFVWHKSWNLPEIVVSINEGEMHYLAQEYVELGCEVMAVYPLKFLNSYYLNQIILDGSCCKRVTENQVSFKFLKFGETSFNHSRNKFCLLVWVYGQNKYKDRDDLFCLISSPIYVDSRKEARKKEVQATPNIAAFTPKHFLSPVGGAKGSIPNSGEGFIMYYSAQNIRNKIKHPFYIVYHFDKLFKLFLNTSSNCSLVQILNLMQASNSNEGNTLYRLDQPSLLMIQVLEPEEQARRKIVSIIDKWKFGSIELSYLDTPISDTKWALVSKDDLRTSYRHYYDNELAKDEEPQARRDTKKDSKVSEGQQGEAKVPCSESSNQQEKQKCRSYELRTVIDLSRPRKKVKMQHQ